MKSNFLPFIKKYKLAIISLVFIAAVAFQFKDPAKISVKLYNFYFVFKEWIDPSFKTKNIPPKSNVPLDIVIPVIEKDLVTVGYTIDSVRQMVMHPLGKIYLVSPESTAIRKLAKEKNCVFKLETEMTDFHTIKKHGGWILQQFLKLNADQFVEQEHYLVIDADTILLRPQLFILNGSNEYIINIHYDPSKSRFNFTKKALQLSWHYPLDLVPHHMVFSKKILKDMKEKISSAYGKLWDQALLQIEQEIPHGLSEYDLYAIYIMQCTNIPYKLTASANTSFYRDKLGNVSNLYGAFSGNYKSISIHSPTLINKTH